MLCAEIAALTRSTMGTGGNRCQPALLGPAPFLSFGRCPDPARLKNLQRGVRGARTAILAATVKN